MPKNYDNKSIHNKFFLDTIHDDYPEDFFDWKVTAQFYTGLHRCYCLIVTKGLNVETSHDKNIKNLKSIDSELSHNLFKLYKNSRQSRYDGFINNESMIRINKINFSDGILLLKSIESEVLKYYPITITSI
jgi:hypothetical protein